MQKSLVALILPVIFSLKLFGQEKYISINQASWLVGSWQGTYKGTPFYEAWRKINDSILVNLQIEIKGNDTLVKEGGVIRLLPTGRIIHGSPNATWELSKLANDEIVFVNDTLRFANRIEWKRSKEDHWLTEIKNPNGKVYYDMVRVEWLDAFVSRFLSRRGGK